MKSIFLRKSLRLALTRPTSLYKGGCFCKNTDEESESLCSLLFFSIYRKKVPGKIPIPFPAQKERLDGFSTRRVRFANSLFYVPFCSAKRWTKSSSLLPFLHYTEKRYRGKSRYLFWRRRRDSTGFQPVVFALRTVYFMSLFAPQKDGRRVRVSYPFCIIQKKGTGENPDTFPAQKERLDGFSTRRVRFANSLFYVPFCSAKRRTKSSSLSKQIHIYKKKKHKGKILVLFLAQKERLDGFSTRRVRFANSLFYVPPRKKMDEEFESLCPFCIIQKKGTGENPDTFSGAEGETRTLAPVTRPTPLAGAPRHQLEYFCIGSVYDTIRLLKERAENPLSLLSGGESGIRTHGTLPYDGFQDRSVITTSVSLRIRRKL